MKYIIIAVVSLTASSLGTICGIGGGVVVKPVLDALGMMSVESVSFLSGVTVLCMSAYSVSVDAWKGGAKVQGQTVSLSMGAAAGGVAGKLLFNMAARLAPNVEMVGALQTACLFVLSLGTFFYTVFKARIATHQVKNIGICLAVGGLLGVLSAFLGIGGGPFNLVFLSFFFSMQSKTAAQNSLFIILCSQMTSLMLTLIRNTVPPFDPAMLVMMAVMGILGGIIGRSINKKIDAQVVDKLFLFMTFLILCICVYNFIRFV